MNEGIMRERIREAIGDTSMTKASKMCGLGETAISKWLVGVCLPSAYSLGRFCETFNVSADWVLGIDGEKGGAD